MKEQMNIVIIGHVDHGKSTLIGRLLADTGSLPQGKLEQVKNYCMKNSRPFEYAFLLDALKDEQSQGITIDSARCFFKTAKRDYIIIDAPGHLEFLKNMVSGASRAEAGILVIDAKEGIRENSKRHGYILSLLGISQVCVLINKMDLVGYDETIFNNLSREYTEFLARIGLKPSRFIPVSAFNGENLAAKSAKMKWYDGITVVDQLDFFQKEKSKIDKPFRMPVQDIYKFTKNADNRRIITGLIECGRIKTGDNVIFYPSCKKSIIDTIEKFGEKKQDEASAGSAPGFTLKSQIYIKPGEIMCLEGEPPVRTASRIRVNIFWMGKNPMVKNRIYKMKLAASRNLVELTEIISTVDASSLSTGENKNQIDQYEAAECIIESKKPIAFDIITEFESTARFVIIDGYEISGGGIIVSPAESGQSMAEKETMERNSLKEFGNITKNERMARLGHKSKFILFTGDDSTVKEQLAKSLEQYLFNKKFFSYYMSFTGLARGLDAELNNNLEGRSEQIRRLGELAKIFTDAGFIFITSASDVDDYDLKALKTQHSPNDILILNTGQNHFEQYSIDINFGEKLKIETAMKEIHRLLISMDILPEYF